MAARQPLLIRRPAQARALVSPVRQEIVDAVAAAGPSTIAQIGEWLGRRPDSLYYHIAALTKVGLLVEAGRRRTGKRFGAVYDVPGRPMVLKYSDLGEAAVVPVVRAALRLAARDFARAVRAEGAVLEGPGRNVWGGRVKGWVDERDLAEVGRLLERLAVLVQRGRPREGAGAHAFTYVVAPAASGRRAKGGRRSAAAGSGDRP